MKTKVLVAKEIDIRLIKLSLPVRYDDDDMPFDFPFRTGDLWEVTVDIDTGKIQEWPEGVEHDLSMKVCDCGTYALYEICENGTPRHVACIEEDYVPHGVVPGKYGDYVELDIKGDGTIANWPKKPKFKQFFKMNADE